MSKSFKVIEIELSDEEIDTWIKRLKEIKDGKEHCHLVHKEGEVLVHRK